MARAWRRLTGPGRVAGVDLARSLAVFGMFAAHLLRIDAPFTWSAPATWIAVVDGNSSILFATLAGVSIGLATGGARPLAGAALGIARGRLAVRALFLWVLGVALTFTGVPVFVILPAYAILFLLALPLLALPARVLLPSAAVIALVMPWVQALIDAQPFWSRPTGSDVSLLLGYHYPFTTWIAFLIAGLGLSRLDVRRLRVQTGALLAGAGVCALGFGLDAAAHPPGAGDAAAGRATSAASTPDLWDQVWTAEPHSTGILEVLGSGGFAIAVIAACLLVCRTPVRWAVLPLRAVGAMPLTAYTAQIIGWGIAASIVLGDATDLGGFRDLDPLGPFVLWTIVGCTAWALLVGRGPVEWLVDRTAKGLVREDRIDIAP
ncbi:DUF418 domain-containing protein [Microbacterium hominis]|uniref:DUF418 domain-containing protein n=1 Tax=Microbacterium hominis TaxID=162426 RepID=A0A7D4TQF5_9MICO|nr:DUF418 domain-containing protein [Microbacterium hominis]